MAKALGAIAGAVTALVFIVAVNLAFIAAAVFIVKAIW